MILLIFSLYGKNESKFKILSKYLSIWLNNDKNLSTESGVHHSSFIYFLIALLLSIFFVCNKVCYYYTQKIKKKQILARNFIDWNLSHYYHFHHFQYFHSYFHFLVQYLYCVVEIVVKNMLFHLQHPKFKLW